MERITFNCDWTTGSCMVISTENADFVYMSGAGKICQGQGALGKGGIFFEKDTVQR